MTRVWIVDDAVPVQKLSYVPSSIPKEGVRHLLESHGDTWAEQDVQVKELCDSLSGDPFDLTVLLSPGGMNRLLQSGVEPPHIVIFDWEGPGFDPDANNEAIRRVLESSFSFVQVYTQLGVAAVDAQIQHLTTQFADRMLPAKAKDDVNATDLGTIVTTAWNDTIAGEVADGVRAKARASVERVLIDLCSVKRTALATLLETLDGGLDVLLMGKLRDEIGSQGIGQLGAVAGGGEKVEATDELRRFQSVFYYHFPVDELVRTGDIVVNEAGAYAMVFTPQCHLERFRNKTGGRLTLNRLLHELGACKRTARRWREINPDRDAQFIHINRRVRVFQRQRQPVVSVELSDPSERGSGVASARPPGTGSGSRFPGQGTREGDSVCTT